MSVTLGERMKAYESNTDYSVGKGQQWIIRLDGSNFSKLMKRLGAEKPFDPRIMEIMTSVSKALLAKFNFVTVYTQSDEITCIPNLIQDQQIEADNMFNLRIQKLTSIVASFASVNFYRQLMLAFPEYSGTIPVFDARVIVLPSVEEVLNCLIWRQRDCIKNAKNLVGQQFFSPKELNRLTSDQQIEKVYEEYDVSFYSYPEEFRNGILVKRVLVELTGYDEKSDSPITYWRGRAMVFSQTLTPKSLDWVLAKYSEMKYDS